MSVRTFGTGEYLKRTANLPTSTAFTFCGWSKMTRITGAGSFQYWGVENADATSSAYLLLGYPETGNFEVSTSGTGGAVSFASNPTDETWFFWALTCSGTGVGSLNGYWAYVTDTTFKTAAARGASFTTARVTLGNDSYDEWMNASYFAVKLYDAVLTSTELWQEMQTVRPVRTANLNIWSPLWDINDEKDYSGNGRDWTSSGTLSSEDNPPIGYGVKSKLFSVVSAAPAATLFRRSLSQRTGSRG